MHTSFAVINSAASTVPDTHKKDAQLKLSKYIILTFQRILRSELFCIQSPYIDPNPCRGRYLYSRMYDE